MTDGSAAVVLAELPDPIGRPQDWDKAVSAAYFRALGASQKVAARAAGCGERTLRDWEACSWWPDAHAEAVVRWRSDLTAEARRSLLRAIKRDGKLALDVLERLDRTLARKELPVSRVQEMLGETIRAIRDELDEATAERVLARIRGIWR